MFKTLINIYDGAICIDSLCFKPLTKFAKVLTKFVKVFLLNTFGISRLRKKTSFESEHYT